MAHRFPDGVWLSGADLGFDALAIAAGGNANGLLIPWLAAHPIRHITIWLTESGASSVSLRLNQERDFNGTTVLRSGLSNIWNTVTTGVMSVSAGGLSAASVGTLPGNPIASLWGAPYAQFNVLNNDGVNAATVTMRIALSWKDWR